MNGQCSYFFYSFSLTQFQPRTLSLTDENRILSYAEKHGVRFSSILLPESGPALSFFDSAAAASGGRAFAFSTRSVSNVGAHLYANLIEAFQGWVQSLVKFV